MKIEMIPTSEIIVRDRARAGPGSLIGLIGSVEQLGLLHPLVVNSRRELVAGGRRLAAVKKLGWQTVPCHLAESLDDALAALHAEQHENTCREPLSPTELVKLGRRIEELEKERARKRKGGRPSKEGATSGKLPEVSTGDTRDKVAAALGVSGKTYEKGRQVVEAAEADPDRFGDLPAKMDEESIHAAYGEMRSRQSLPPEEGGEEEFPSPLDGSLPRPAFDASKPPLPSYFKGGNKTDPDHPFADILNKFNALAGAITKAMATEKGELLRQYLTSLSKHAYKVRMVLYTSDVIAGDEVKKGRPKFVGLYPLRKLIDRAGTRKTPMKDAEVLKLFGEACAAAEADILNQEATE